MDFKIKHKSHDTFLLYHGIPILLDARVMGLSNKNETSQNNLGNVCFSTNMQICPQVAF